MPPPPINRYENALAWVLRSLGAINGLAILAVFLPTGAMSEIHEAWGFGAMHRSSVFDYLARSVSAFHALYGAALWGLATDVRRYRKLIRFFAMAAILHGFLLVGISLHADMPALWVLLEAGGHFVPAVAFLWLLDRAMRENPQSLR